MGVEAPIVNGYVAKHYPAYAINWLHCCFGIGSTLAPPVMAYFLTAKDSWRMGFQTISIAEFCIMAALIISIPLWRLHGPVFPGEKYQAAETIDSSHNLKTIKLSELFRLPGGKSIPINMFIYCSFEVTIYFWATSFLTEEKGMSPGVAAGLMTFVYGGQVAGRIIGSFLTMKFSDRQIIRVGLIVSLAGIIAFTMAPDSMIPVIFLIVGIASGPIFPLYIHEVPSIVGKEAAQAVIGLQMASANLGNALIPLLVGIISGIFGFKVFPFALLVLIALSVVLKMTQDYKLSVGFAAESEAGALRRF